MLLFLSYSRKDKVHVDPVANGLKQVGHSVWFDQDLTGGLEWWEAILDKIRSCEVFLAIVSKPSLASTACSREREYALALGKPVLPVLIERVRPEVLPPDIARRELVDFSAPDMAAAFRLAGAISRLPASKPLPDPLPIPPDVPLSYLSDISQKLYAATLTREEQLGITAQLYDAVHDEDDYDVALELARLMERRDDLLVTAERRLREIFAAPRPAASSASSLHPPLGPSSEPPRVDTPVKTPPIDSDVSQAARAARPEARATTAGTRLGGARTLVDSIASPSDIAVVGEACYVLRDSSHLGVPELLRVDLPTAAITARIAAPNAWQLLASSGGVVVNARDRIVVYSPTLHELSTWQVPSGATIIHAEITRRCAWALTAFAEKEVQPRMSRGYQYTTQLVRIQLDTATTTTLLLGDDTYWVDPVHFRGLQLIATDGPEGEEVVSLRGAWTTGAVWVQKSKKASFATESVDTVDTIDAGAYSGGSGGDPDVRQIRRAGDHLLLSYSAVPNVTGKAAVTSSDLRSTKPLRTSDKLLHWLPTTGDPVLLDADGKTIDILRLQEDGNLVLCDSIQGDFMAGIWNLFNVQRDMRAPIAERGRDVWWGVTKPAGIVRLDAENRVTRFDAPSNLTVHAVTEHIYVALSRSGGGFDLAEMELPG